MLSLKSGMNAHMLTYRYLSPHDCDATGDWTVVVEKIRASTGPCLRDGYTNNTMIPERIVFTVGAGLRNTSDVVVQT